MITPVIIESLDQEGRGVAHVDGKVIFIEGALPGELVTYNAYRKKPNFELAQVAQILKPAFGRVPPPNANISGHAADAVCSIWMLARKWRRNSVSWKIVSGISAR